MRRLTVRVDWNVPLIIAFSVFAWVPLLGPTYFLEAHDAPHSLFFLTDFHQAIQDGAFYPRWATDFALGYGYPVFILYSPLAFYVAEVFHLLGAGITTSVKATYILAFILSGVSMYAFVKRVLGSKAGILAALVYVYVPYHLVDIYVRSAFSEFCSFVFLPLVLLSFYELLTTREARWLAWAALAYGATILTHVATALTFTPLLGAYILCLLLAQGGREWRGWLRLGSLAATAILLALAVSAIFLLPMLVERRYVAQEQWTAGSYDYAKHFIYFSQLLSPFWGYGYAGEGLADEMAFQLGAMAVVLALAGIVLPHARSSPAQGQILFFTLAFLVLVAAMTPLAAPIWRALPLAALIQFPWRLLSLAAFAISFLAGSAALGLEETSKEWPPALAVLVLLVILGSYGYATPEHTEAPPRAQEPVAVIDFETFHPPDRVGMTVWVEEQPQDSPLVPQYLAGKPLVKAHPLTEGARVEMIRHGGASEEIWVYAPQEAEIEFYTYYFPGWRAYVDGQEVPLYPSGPHGLIALHVPQGEHRVLIRFQDTPIRKTGAIVTILGLVVVFGLLARRPFSGIMGFSRAKGLG